jgi:hypothetical protein
MVPFNECRQKTLPIRISKGGILLGIDQTLAYIEESQWKVGLD